MPETFHVDEANYRGEKPNPHGGVLHKFYVSLTDEGGMQHQDVYWQRKSRELDEGEEVYGHIEQGEYGPRFKTDQKPDGNASTGSGGNFRAPNYQREPDNSRNWSIERQTSAKCAAQVLQGVQPDAAEHAIPRLVDAFHAAIRKQDFVDADVGGGTSADSDPPVSQASAADVSAEEASPAQKRRLTTEFKKVGLVPEVMKAVVMVRCRSEKATKDGASSLIQDLVDGATAESLIAEVYDAKRAGDPVGIRAAALIPENSPVDTEGLPELDADGKQLYGVKDEADDSVPF